MMEIQRELAERSLADFIRIGWRYIDPADYVGNWHIDAIGEHLEAVANGQIRRLIINEPPRHMKSLSCSVAWPAWVWAQEKRSPLTGPSVGFLSASYAQHLSVRDNVKCRRLIESPWYQCNWGNRFQLSVDQNTKTRFENNQGGYRLVSSVDAGTTGDGGDIITIDDPISARDANSASVREATNDWFDGTMSTRLNDPKTGAYVIIMQRLHEQDLVGHILSKDDGWTHLCLPARYDPQHPHVWVRDPRKEKGELLWPARMGEPEVKKLEVSLGIYGTAGQLQQLPSPAGGAIFLSEWWKYYPPAALPPVRRIVQSWDTAFKKGQENDFSVCTTWAVCEQGYYLLDLWKEKVEFPELKQVVKSKGAQQWAGMKPAAILVEDKASGQSLIQELRRDSMLPILPVQVDRDKIARAYAVTPLIQAGRVFLPEGAPWLADYIASLTGFPNAAHDDDVDSTTQALHYLSDGQGLDGWLAWANSKLEQAAA